MIKNILGQNRENGSFCLNNDPKLLKNLVSWPIFFSKSQKFFNFPGFSRDFAKIARLKRIARLVCPRLQSILRFQDWLIELLVTTLPEGALQDTQETFPQHQAENWPRAQPGQVLPAAAAADRGSQEDAQPKQSQGQLGILGPGVRHLPPHAKAYNYKAYNWLFW